jgi:hypothetical protein
MISGSWIIEGTNPTSGDERPIDSVMVVVTVTVDNNAVDVVDLTPRPSLFLKLVKMLLKNRTNGPWARLSPISNPLTSNITSNNFIFLSLGV